MARRATKRQYDVVLYGASGFVGRQTVAYFAQLPSPKRGRRLRWALAGRDRAKLEDIRHACGADNSADIVVADAQDGAALAAVAANTAVVLSTAGPFALYGSELVAACARQGTHYVDITGETPWVHDMIAQHHDQARRSGARIIPLCGFDSIPSDIGTWLLVQAMRERHGEDCLSAKASFSIRGGVNGGTLASALNMAATPQAKAALADPFLLNPEGTRPRNPGRHRDPQGPLLDPDFGAWMAPFFMGAVNTRVVRRSAALLGYGPRFHYQEYLRMGAGPVAGALATGLSVGMAVSQLALNFGPVLKVAKQLVPGPGSGPSEHSMDHGSFRCELVAKSATGHEVRARVAGQGDPGNRATTRFVCEVALCLALEADKLPESPGGLLTPASGLGDVLVRRLRAAGMTLEVAA
jgi:short subunit dehydrogenase-like uncharacterized protein